MTTELQPVIEPATLPDQRRERQRARFARQRLARQLAALVRAARRRRLLLVSFALLPLALILIPALWLVHHIYFDRSAVPDLSSFIRFEPPTTGVVRDTHGKVLIELAREYRRVVSFDEIPLVVRQAILAAEDKSFFTHSGVDYRALPRVLQKSAARSVSAWWHGGRKLQLLLPQGGSTLTQQLVRGYFLQYLTSRADDDVRFRAGPAPPRLLSLFLGAPATNKLLRKLEEVRLTLWLEDEMRERFGSKERAKREIFARYASFLYLGSGRYGYAAAAEYYFGRSLSSFTQDDAADAALLAAIGKSPQSYEPRPGNLRLLDRRNQILALMARNGYIPESLVLRCQRLPIEIARRSPIKTDAPAVIEHVLDELSRHGATVEALFEGRISVEATVDARVQEIVNEALEQGLALYEKRHPNSSGSIQGSIVVLQNGNAAILAETGGRQVYRDRQTRYSDYNRVRGSLRQPGSAMKPLVYLAAFESGMGLDTEVPDEPIGVEIGGDGSVKWIANDDSQFKGRIPIRQALAESRNAVAVWLTREIGVESVIRAASEMGIHTQLKPYLSTALGASEVLLLELADAYRAIASGVHAEPHIIDRVTAGSGETVYEAPRGARALKSSALLALQEGLRGVVRLPSGTARRLAARDFPIAVMGKTGTTSDFRDALFVGSTYGPTGITVAVRIGFDDNRSLGARETGGRAALPIFREIMLRVYAAELVGKAPRIPRQIEDGIDRYLAMLATPGLLAPAEPIVAEGTGPASGALQTGAEPIPVAAGGGRR